jgi:hypothetical protein
LVSGFCSVICVDAHFLVKKHYLSFLFSFSQAVEMVLEKLGVVI